MSDLHSLSAAVGSFADERDWNQFHDPKNLAMALSSEAGELAAIFRWIDNAEADDFATRDSTHAAAVAEIGDVGILLLLMCRRLNVTLEDAVRSKLDANRLKYPVELVRGSPDPVR